MLTIELSRFRVKEGKSARVDEWLAFLKEHMSDTLLTLEQEKMFVETIHRETLDGREYLYWFSIQGEGGQEVYDSESYIDREHLKYWDECIDPTYRNNKIPSAVIMIPDRIQSGMV